MEYAAETCPKCGNHPQKVIENKTLASRWLATVSYVCCDWVAMGVVPLKEVAA